MKATRLVLCAFLLGSVSFVFADSPGIVMKDFSLIRRADGFAFNLGDDGPQVITRLGSPDRVKRIIPGGGQYSIMNMFALVSVHVFYNGLFLKYFENNGRIYSYRTASPRFSSYKGITVGMSYDEVMKRCGREVSSVYDYDTPQYFDEADVSYYHLIAVNNLSLRFNSGGDDGPPFLGFLFDRNKKLIMIMIDHC